jgi:hypothetical protein
MASLSQSMDNSPGKLMNTVKLEHSFKYKAPKQSPPFGQTAETVKRGSPKAYDFTKRADSLEDCEK